VSSRVEQLCRSCAHSAAVDGGSVALVSTQGSRVVLAATDGLGSDIENAQITLGEGPYVDAATSLAPVLVPDLSDPGAESNHRWPFFAKQAETLGVGALFAFPIRVGTLSFGTLGLYREEPGPLATPELSGVLEALDELGRTLLDLETWADDQHGSPDADSTTGITIGTAQLHQAAGMVMIQLDVTILEAMALLRAAAFTEGIHVTSIANQIVKRRRRFGKRGSR
jgi:hypothetical protein